MGDEFAQEWEWNHDASLDWHLLEGPPHRGISDLVRDLNHLYRDLPALHQRDCEQDGFAWIDCADWEHGVIAYVRRAADPADFVVVVCNFTPVPRHGYRVGVPAQGPYAEIFNSDSEAYGGGNVGNLGSVASESVDAHGHRQSLSLVLPPLAVIVLRPAADAPH